MKVTDISHGAAELRKHIRTYVPDGDGAEMVCSALRDDDVCVKRKVATDARGVAGAISYTIYSDHLRIHSLGSLQNGAGTALVRAVERIAKRKGLAVTVASMETAVGFYKRLGYTVIRLDGKSIVQMRKDFTM